MVIPHGLPDSVHPFLITGPPRSGTSMLAALFARASNVFCANEPEELHRFRMDYANPSDLMRGFMIQSGRKITEEHQIVTKTRADDPTKISLDTFHEGATVAAIDVDVDTDRDVFVGAKLCRPIIDRIAFLAADWDRLRFVVTIRDPFETLRSWCHSFGWDETMKSRRSAMLCDRLKSQVEWTGDLFDHHAQLWALLVNDALMAQQAYSDRILIVLYHEVVSHADEMLTLMLSHIGVRRDTIDIDVSDIKPRDRKGQYEDLTDQQCEIIKNRCMETWNRVPVRYHESGMQQGQ